jgi:hypothetical protein
MPTPNQMVSVLLSLQGRDVHPRCPGELWKKSRSRRRQFQFLLAHVWKKVTAARDLRLDCHQLLRQSKASPA